MTNAPLTLEEQPRVIIGFPKLTDDFFIAYDLMHVPIGVGLDVIQNYGAIPVKLAEDRWASPDDDEGVLVTPWLGVDEEW